MCLRKESGCRASPGGRKQVAHPTLAALRRAAVRKCHWWGTGGGGRRRAAGRGGAGQVLERVLGAAGVERMEGLELQRALDRMPDVVQCPRCRAVCLEDPDGSHCTQCARCACHNPKP